jgi:hypothetical protein
MPCHMPHGMFVSKKKCWNIIPIQFQIGILPISDLEFLVRPSQKDGKNQKAKMAEKNWKQGHFCFLPPPAKWYGKKQK